VDNSNAATSPTLELWLFDTTATPNNDNASFAPADSVVNTCIGVINLTATGYAGDPATTGNKVYDAGPISVPFVCGGASSSIFGMLVVRNAYTPVSAQVLKIRLRILQD
jgi:hypothetical protein